VVHVSESQAAEARALGLAPAGRTRVIVNRIDAAFVRAAAARAPISRAMLTLRPDALVLATVARFDPVKRLEVVVRALPLLVARVPEAQLLIVGDGPERDALRALARRLAPGTALSSRARSRTRHACSRSSISTSPHRAARACPSRCSMPWPADCRCWLATEAPGHVDAVESGVTGRLVPLDDAPGLAAAAALLLRDPVLRARMGRAGRVRVERRFARARALGAIADLYREAVGFPAGGPPARRV
jgi:glycosyltransferase involved in cell wall biosynthesis